MKVVVLSNKERQLAHLDSDMIYNPIEIDDIETQESQFIFEYPRNQEDVEHMVEGNKIALLDIDGNWQLYRITNTYKTLTIDGLSMLKVECDNSYYELAQMEFVELDLTEASAADAIEAVLANCYGWEVNTVEIIGDKDIKTTLLNPIQALNEIVKTWGGVLRFRVVITDPSIDILQRVKKYVDLLNRQGNYTGQILEVNRNIGDTQVMTSVSDVITAVYPIGCGEESITDPLTGDVKSAELDIAGVGWIKGANVVLYPEGPEAPAPVSKPLLQRWIGDDDLKAAYGILDPATQVMKHRFGRYESQAKYPETLIWEGWRYIQRNNTLVNIQANVTALGESEEYSHERIRLGDTVIIKLPDISPQTVEVYRIERHRKDPASTRIELGNYRPLLSDKQIEQEEKIKQINRLQGLWEEFDKRIKAIGEPIELKKSWEFTTNIEGWAAFNHISGFGWQTNGYIGGIITGDDPFIISADNLGVSITNAKTIKIRMKNSTASTTTQIYFTTNTDQNFNEAKSKNFTTIANDSIYTEYTIDMSNIAGWTGTLRRLRVDPSTVVTSGSFSIDHIRIYENPPAINWEYTSDIEGWTVAQQVTSFAWQTGGYIGGTITGTDPRIRSADNLEVVIGNAKYIKIRMKNRSSSTTGKVYFSTNTNTPFSESKSKTLTLVANDPNYTMYTIDMSDNELWTGTLKRIRVHPGTGITSGSFSIDYIRIVE